jgi:hypothetical protein
VQRSADRNLSAIATPFAGVVALTLKQADECYVSADASFVDYEVDGRISLALHSPYAR